MKQTPLLWIKPHLFQQVFISHRIFLLLYYYFSVVLHTSFLPRLIQFLVNLYSWFVEHAGWERLQQLLGHFYSALLGCALIQKLAPWWGGNIPAAYLPLDMNLCLFPPPSLSLEIWVQLSVPVTDVSWITIVKFPRAPAWIPVTFGRLSGGKTLETDFSWCRVKKDWTEAKW